MRIASDDLHTLPALFSENFSSQSSTVTTVLYLLYNIISLPRHTIDNSGAPVGK